VKAAVLSREIRRRHGWCEVLVHTGQHYDENMSDVFFEELEIPAPDVHLGIGSGSHGQQTGRMLEAIERVLFDTRPDWVLVFGDTNSTLSGALAAAKVHIPVAHVESGLRSFNRKMPEETNRVLTDHLSTLLFAPTVVAVANLQREGINDNQIRLVGDVMCDAILHYRHLALRRSSVLRRLQIEPKQFVLATIHRAENTDVQRRLTAIVDGLCQVAQLLTVVFPVHPRTRAALQKFGLWQAVTQSLAVIEPVGYLDMVMLESNARQIITDSGGLQKEAFFCRTPCITLRDETEWGELVDLGWNQLLSPMDDARFAEKLVSAVQHDELPDSSASPYGTGDACRRICDALDLADPPKPPGAVPERVLTSTATVARHHRIC
jgi:UDP-GlcNAc3NAcA epimerase